jgi:hypothetical protein
MTNPLKAIKLAKICSIICVRFEKDLKLCFPKKISKFKIGKNDLLPIVILKWFNPF